MNSKIRLTFEQPCLRLQPRNGLRGGVDVLVLRLQVATQLSALPRLLLDVVLVVSDNSQLLILFSPKKLAMTLPRVTQCPQQKLSMGHRYMMSTASKKYMGTLVINVQILVLTGYSVWPEEASRAVCRA